MFIINDSMLSLIDEECYKVISLYSFDYVAPSEVFEHLASIMVWNARWYDLGSDNIMMVLQHESERVGHIFRRLSCQCIISWKCSLSSERWVFGSLAS